MPRVSSHHPLLRTAALGALLGCLLALGTAAVSPAATLGTDTRCYLQGAPLRLTAGGLTPGAPLTVSLDDKALSYRDGSRPRADEAGAFASAFATPGLAPGIVEQRHVLAVDDGTSRPQTRFTVTRPAGADFQPSSGNPRRLRARFSVWGFALPVGAPGRARVWLHWLDPARTVRASAPLGRMRGDCGSLTTGLRQVFPFNPEAGRWVLVVDTHRRYRVQAAGPRAKIAVHIRALSL